MLPGSSAADIDTMADEKESLYREIAARSLGLIVGAHAFVMPAR